MTREVADRINGDLRELAAVPQTIATLLEARSDRDEAQIERALKDVLDKNPRIFGLCVALEPHVWRKDREDFALYVYRRRDGLAVKQLVPPSYQPHYRQWDWYRAAKDNPRGRWGEPYIGQGGDHTPMVTFSAPIRPGGRFVGAVTADLAMEYFRDLHSRVGRLDLGPKSYCLVVSAGGRILAHPLARYEFPSPESNLATLPLDESLPQPRSPMGRKCRRGRAGDRLLHGPAGVLPLLARALLRLDARDRHLLSVVGRTERREARPMRIPGWRASLRSVHPAERFYDRWVPRESIRMPWSARASRWGSDPGRRAGPGRASSSSDDPSPGPTQGSS